eukprot:7259537-Prymnesium_polylepis.1
MLMRRGTEYLVPGHRDKAVTCECEGNARFSPPRPGSGLVAGRPRRGPYRSIRGLPFLERMEEAVNLRRRRMRLHNVRMQ